MGRFISVENQLRDINLSIEQAKLDLKDLCIQLLEESTEEDLEGFDVEINLTGEDPTSFEFIRYSKNEGIYGIIEGQEQYLDLDSIDFDQQQIIAAYLVKLSKMKLQVKTVLS